MLTTISRGLFERNWIVQMRKYFIARAEPNTVTSYPSIYLQIYLSRKW